VVLQRRGARGSAAGVPAVGQCALRVCVQGPTVARLRGLGAGLLAGGLRVRERLTTQFGQRDGVDLGNFMGDSVLVVPVRASHLTGESGNGSVRCGGDRLLPSSGRLLVGARLPPSRASPGVAPCGVAATDTFGDLCWRAPPTAVGESGRGSVWCGGGRHPPLFRREPFLCASPRRGRVRNGSALSGGSRRLPVRSYHHRGRV